jgi:hypothetical protein
MATYLESLMGDRERMERALTALIETEAGRVRDLQAEVASHAKTLDEQIIRLMVFRGLYGRSAQETLSAETAAEEASKPHTAALQELASHQKILQALQEALIKLKQGQPLDPSASGGARLTVADILES